jgi:hypothetical protein
MSAIVAQLLLVTCRQRARTSQDKIPRSHRAGPRMLAGAARDNYACESLQPEPHSVPVALLGMIDLPEDQGGRGVCG